MIETVEKYSEISDLEGGKGKTPPYILTVKEMAEF